MSKQPQLESVSTKLLASVKVKPIYSVTRASTADMLRKVGKVTPSNVLIAQPSGRAVHIAETKDNAAQNAIRLISWKEVAMNRVLNVNTGCLIVSSA